MQMNTKRVEEVNIEPLPSKSLVMIGFDYTGTTRNYWLGSKTSDGRVLHLSHALGQRDLIVVHSNVLKVGDEVMLTLDEGKKQRAKIMDLRVAA